MTPLDANTWQGVRAEVKRRIRKRIWKPGESIPNEADLAEEFGCARATVNRALRDLAQDGVLERKRKSGTRVALHPNSRAVLEIPLIRKEIEGRAQTYSYALISRSIEPPPMTVAISMELPQSEPLLHILAIHLADRVPYVLEDRWINLAVSADVRAADFTAKSPNEWLLENIPFSRSELSILAANADPNEAEILGTSPGTALLELRRTTWNDSQPVTTVRLLHMPGYRISSSVSG